MVIDDCQMQLSSLFRKGEAARREAAQVVCATAWGRRVTGVWVSHASGMDKNPCRWTGGTEISDGLSYRLPYPAYLIRDVASNWDAETPPPAHEPIRFILKANYAAWMELAKALRYRGCLAPVSLRAFQKKIQRVSHG